MNTQQILVSTEAEHGDLITAIFGEEFTPKVVGWETVRNIANSLTNQLYTGMSIDIAQAHMAIHSVGGREWTLEPGCKGNWRPSENEANYSEGWVAFGESDICFLGWSSNTSGCELEARKVSPNRWVLSFTPGYDPAYRGSYFGMYDYPEGVANISSYYVYEYPLFLAQCYKAND